MHHVFLPDAPRRRVSNTLSGVDGRVEFVVAFAWECDEARVVSLERWSNRRGRNEGMRGVHLTRWMERIVCGGTQDVDQEAVPRWERTPEPEAW